MVQVSSAQSSCFSRRVCSKPAHPLRIAATCRQTNRTLQLCRIAQFFPIRSLKSTLQSLLFRTTGNLRGDGSRDSQSLSSIATPSGHSPFSVKLRVHIASTSVKRLSSRHGFRHTTNCSAETGLHISGQQGRSGKCFDDGVCGELAFLIKSLSKISRCARRMAETKSQPGRARALC